MNIKQVVENVVQFGSGTTTHKHVIDINDGSATREHIVHLSNDPKLQRSQIERHVDEFHHEMKGMFPNHEEAPRKFNDGTQVVNHVRAYQWYDSENSHMAVKHRFIPIADPA